VSLEARIRRLEAAEAIRGLKAHYCDLCDAGYDADALACLFTPDAVWDGGQLGRFEGREAIRGFFANLPRALSLAIHHVTNPVVVVSEDAESAEGRWYLLQAATLTQGHRAVWIAGRYEDRFRRVDGEWRFQRVALHTRFFTPYRSGWAEVPFVDVARRDA
jgi:ketosteroid isomerase-like protein